MSGSDSNTDDNVSDNGNGDGYGKDNDKDNDNYNGIISSTVHKTNGDSFITGGGGDDASDSTADGIVSSSVHTKGGADIGSVAMSPLYLPIDPSSEVVDIVCDSGVPLQSAAKVPILISFLVKTKASSSISPSISSSTSSSSAAAARVVRTNAQKGEAKHAHIHTHTHAHAHESLERKACIFKIGDDCRQDALAIQVLKFCQAKFRYFHSLSCLTSD